MNTLVPRHSPLFTAAMAALAATASAATPVVSGTSMAQSSTSRAVTITYELADAPAVITLDVETNCVVNGETVWASIGGEAVSNAKGDVWKQVAVGSREITWRPDLSWPDHLVPEGGARAVVTAWALDNTPAYMVVDISSAAQPNTQKYYPAADFLPGGLLGNPDYRVSKLVMRKIMAKDVEWMQGSTSQETQRTAARESTQHVTLTNNYYIGVFPVTQGQWSQLASNPSIFTSPVDRDFRPVENVCYNEVRNSYNGGYNWPNAPHSNSFLGLLRTRTGIDFDMPSEAQWEFACRAGNGSGHWGDSSVVLNSDPDGNLGNLGRYKTNNPGGTSATASLAPEAGGTSVVGTFAPNDWGIYDMHGNVWEWCLDFYQDNIATATDTNGNLYAGRVNINPGDPTKTLAGAAGSGRTLRGGSWNSVASSCRSAYRGSSGASEKASSFGLRVVCTAGLR